MSELMHKSADRKGFRWQLLTSVSALALLGVVYGAGEAKATDDDSDRPMVWIELGGQLSRLDDGQEAFSPPLMADRPPIFAPSQKFEKPPLYSIDEYGKISFQPDASNWVFSAFVRYGHSVSSRDVRQQTNPKVFVAYFGGQRYAKYPSAEKFANTNAQNSEHHFILDFQAGKDVGLGMFGGRSGSSVLNLGVRFAQFSSKSNIALQSDPDWHFHTTSNYGIPIPAVVFHSNVGAMLAARSFHGVGPSLSWNASAPLVGNSQGSELTLDWGLNAALLFGRQRAEAHHHSTEQYHPTGKYYLKCKECRQTISQPPPVNLTRARTVTVPNVGGFAGITFRKSIAKISLGYRADFFFGPMDGGIDTAHRENVGFYGPFASISVGIGG